MIPKSLDFVGHPVKVHLLSREECMDKCGHPHGGYNFKLLSVYINKDMPETRQEETLLHEIMEMLLYYAGGFEEDNQFIHAAFQKYVSLLFAILKRNGLWGTYESQMSKMPLTTRPV